MSLVDYAASSDEDEPQLPSQEPEEKKEQVEGGPQKQRRFQGPASAPPSMPDDSVPNHNRVSKKSQPIVSDQSPELKLPDASLLLNAPTTSPYPVSASDHSSRVAAAMAENAARKRELNVTPASYPRNKVPKGNLPHSKNIPDTVDGRLLPPQLAGRSNIVTEDINKLFVRKNTHSSSTE